MALLDEVSHGEGILVGVTASEALVGHVEEGVVALLLDDVADLPPLLLGGVHTGGVVGAGVEQEDAALGGGLDVGDHALEVEPDRLLVVVPVLLDAEAGVAEHRLVVRPRRRRDVDLLVARVEPLQEGGADAEGARARDRLGHDDAVEGRGVGSVRELDRRLGELGNTRDTGIFLVEARCDHLLFGGADGRQNVGLALVISVGTDTWIGEEFSLA